MYNSYSNYFVNPAAPFTYQDLPQLRERQAKDPTMCYYTVKFFECDHKTDDNVKGCSLWKKTGTHCDIDNPAVKKREDCSIRSENATGLCPRCQSKDRARLLKEEEEKRARIEREREEELMQRDLEKARLADQEESRRSAEAHEAHMRRVQEESEASWRTEYESRASQGMEESAAQASKDLAVQEVEALNAAIEASRKKNTSEMKDCFGWFVEDGSSRLEAVKLQSTMDWHHKKWVPGAEQSQDNEAYHDVNNSMSFRVSETHRHFSTSSHNYSVSTTHDASTSPSKSSDTTEIFSASNHISIPRPLQPKSTSEDSSITSNTSTTQSTQSTVTTNSSSTIIPRSPSSTASALSRSSAYTIDTHILFQKVAELRTTTTRTTTRTTTNTVREPSPPPPSPSPAPPSQSPPPAPTPPRVSAPAFPSIEFSQPPKDQDYGHHFIGGRRQPIHPSQKLAADHPLSPATPDFFRAHAPQPTVRLEGAVTLSAPSSPSSAAGCGVPSTSTQRTRTRRPPKSIPQEEPVNELQAMWNRKGIKRETDEPEDDGITTASISPSESVSQISGGRSKGRNRQQ